MLLLLLELLASEIFDCCISSAVLFNSLKSLSTISEFSTSILNTALILSLSNLIEPASLNPKIKLYNIHKFSSDLFSPFDFSSTRFKNI